MGTNFYMIKHIGKFSNEDFLSTQFSTKDYIVHDIIEKTNDGFDIQDEYGNIWDSKEFIKKIRMSDNIEHITSEFC